MASNVSLQSVIHSACLLTLASIKLSAQRIPMESFGDISLAISPRIQLFHTFQNCIIN